MTESERRAFSGTLAWSEVAINRIIVVWHVKLASYTGSKHNYIIDGAKHACQVK